MFLPVADRTKGFPGGPVVKNPPASAGDGGLILGSGRSPGEGNDHPLQYSCLENPTDGGAWQATVPQVAKSRTQLSDFTFPFTLLHLRAIQDTGQWVYSSE